MSYHGYLCKLARYLTINIQPYFWQKIILKKKIRILSDVQVTGALKNIRNEMLYFSGMTGQGFVLFYLSNLFKIILQLSLLLLFLDFILHISSLFLLMIFTVL